MYLGRSPVGYLGALGASTNEMWVNQYQNPFNNNYLFPITQAVASGSKTKAQGYAELSAAYERIKADAVAFVNSLAASPMLQRDAQATVDRWRAGDGPLIEGFLRDWAAGVAIAAPAPAAGPTTVFQPLVYTAPPPAEGSIAVPTIVGQAFAPTAAVGPSMPAAPMFAPAMETGAPMAAPGGFLGEWAPWLIGAAVIGFAFSGRRGRPRAG